MNHNWTNIVLHAYQTPPKNLISHISFTSRKPINWFVFSSWWLVCLKLGEFVSVTRRLSSDWDSEKRGEESIRHKAYKLSLLQGVSIQCKNENDCFALSALLQLCLLLVWLMPFALRRIHKPTLIGCSSSSSDFLLKQGFLLLSGVQGSNSPGKQQEWQTCCHAVVGGGAKLGPLFTVCLFLSYWDLTGTVGQGQLVISKPQMPGIPASSINSERPSIHSYACSTQTSHSQVSLDCDNAINVMLESLSPSGLKKIWS